VRFHMVARTGHRDLTEKLELPWDLPLAEWKSDRIVEVARGISRHVVRFIEYGGSLYALKELPERLAVREYRLLGELAARKVPVVEIVGVVSERGETDEAPGAQPPEAEMDAVLITRHLEFSLPYRSLFTGRGVPDVRNRLLDALSELLVRLHLAGFFWGDCSLSNTLFRRDAGALAAYLVDAETGELHPQLSDGQRLHDLEVAEMNIAGELMDLQAAEMFPAEEDPVETAEEVPKRYASLWTELTREEEFGPDERYRIDARLRRLNELGFDVEEVELVATSEGKNRLRLPARVVESGHHRRRLFELTGLWAQENQARRLLNDLAAYRCLLEVEQGRPLPEAVVAHRWLLEVFDPTVASIPETLRGKLEPAEVFHEILEHRWFLSETEGVDVGLEEAARSYIDNVLQFVPDEREVLPPRDTEELEALHVPAAES
jgi:Domain of unknown function (DUF4032)/Lipopolysaccharide kinase (Kdo/WaaP) family